MEHDVKLAIEIKNKNPVELADYAHSMMSLGIEYNRQLGSGTYAVSPDDVKLYVKEVRSGSIITELVAAAAPYTIPFAEHSGTILEYAKHLKGWIEWLTGRNGQPPAEIDKTTLQNIHSIVEPIAKDNGSQLNIGAINITGEVTLNLTVSSLDANAIQNSVRRHIEAMKEPATGIHEQVVMYWAQARNQTDNKSGDKARIESIHKGDVKVRFANDKLKETMLHATPFPFSRSFVVDVAVETREGRPVLYKVLELHETIDNDD